MDTIVKIDVPNAFGPWVSSKPVSDQEGEGPILLFNTTSPGVNQKTMGIIAPGYPTMWASKTGGPFQLSQKKARGYIGQTAGGLVLSPVLGEVHVAREEMVRLTSRLKQEDVSMVEVLQAIGMLLLWQSNPIEAHKDLQAALIAHMEKQGLEIPPYLNVGEGMFNAIERTFEAAPETYSKDMLKPGSILFSFDGLLAATLGELLKGNLIAGWKKAERPQAPTMTPKANIQGQISNWVSNGYYAIPQVAGDWIRDYTTANKPRKVSANTPWNPSENSPDFNPLLENEKAVPIRLVGTCVKEGSKKQVILQTPTGKYVHVDCKYFVTVMAHPFCLGETVRLQSQYDDSLAPVHVVVGSEIRGVVMPVRN